MPQGTNWKPASRTVVVRKRRKGIYMLPNLVTLAALFGGFYAIVMAMNGRYDLAAIGIFCAMVLDSLDGRVARMTNTQSAFGEQMDSCATWCRSGRHRPSSPTNGRCVAWAAGAGLPAFVYCACAALRLARFNVNTGVVDKRLVPGPAFARCGSLVIAGFIWLMNELG
jgi:CDP-diacylglycerol--serine O-phosphatidyltransferase